MPDLPWGGQDVVGPQFRRRHSRRNMPCDRGIAGRICGRGADQPTAHSPTACARARSELASRRQRRDGDQCARQRGTPARQAPLRPDQRPAQRHRWPGNSLLAGVRYRCSGRIKGRHPRDPGSPLPTYHSAKNRRAWAPSFTYRTTAAAAAAASAATTAIAGDTNLPGRLGDPGNRWLPRSAASSSAARAATGSG